MRAPVCIILLGVGVLSAFLGLGIWLVVASLFGFFHLQASSTLSAQMAGGLFWTLYGLVSLRRARRTQVRTDPHPPRRGLSLLFSKAAKFFWGGTAFCAIAAAQIAVPASTHWLTILFWVIFTGVILGPFLFDLFRFLLRRLRWLAHRRP